jgi:ATP-dependent Clp protease ATP-binding subunit ClpX
MSEKENEAPVPSPEEISKKLTDFLQENFGQSAGFNSFPDMSSPEKEEEPPAKPEIKERVDVFDFNYLPKDICAHLDRFVIRQEEAKKALSIAVCDHYHHAKYLRRLQEDESQDSSSVEFAKQNVVIVGPTGVGKTYLVKHIAEMIGVPFVKADATKFSETGYVGGDVDDLVRELVQKADGDVDLAEHGIIYIDEIDKLASNGNSMGRDVSGRGVQTALLKLMEETEVQLRNPMDIQSQMQAVFDLKNGQSGPKAINTRDILFIVSGAFSGLEELVRKRLSQGQIGFGTSSEEILMDNELFGHVGTQDFIDFGFEAEFIGRLPIRVVCEHLDAKDLLEIMKSSEGSLLRQYEQEFAAYGIQAKFEQGAMEIIAERAAQEKTGARGLMTVCERILRNFKFELPGTSVSELKINADLVNNNSKVLEKYKKKGRKVSVGRVSQELELFSSAFLKNHGVRIEFSEDAVEAIGERAVKEGTRPLQLCEFLFKDYQFGLKLIQKNTGKDEFTVNSEAVTDPDSYLSSMVVSSYRDAKTK